jgi:hypothetical protein
MVSEAKVTRADYPRVLSYIWGGNETKWELEPTSTGTKLTLWATINKGFIAMGAAGWHLCIAVMDSYLSGDPVGRRVGMDALKDGNWQRLNTEYSERFGVKEVSW